MSLEDLTTMALFDLAERGMVIHRLDPKTHLQQWKITEKGLKYLTELRK